MSTCSPPSAIACVSVLGGSYSWMGCYQDSSATGFPIDISSQGIVTTGFIGSASDCIIACSTSNVGVAYSYASIELNQCFCGTNLLATPPAPADPTMCNIFCTSDPTQVCGGYDGIYAYNAAYQYIDGGSLDCPVLSATTSSSIVSSTSSSAAASSSSDTSTSAASSSEAASSFIDISTTTTSSITSTSLLSSTSTSSSTTSLLSSISSTSSSSSFSTLSSTSSLTSFSSISSSTTLGTSTVVSSSSTSSSSAPPQSTSCHNLQNGNFASGLLSPWTTNAPDSVIITNATVPSVIPFAPSQYYLQASLSAGQNITIQQVVAVCPSTAYAPIESAQVLVDPSGGKRGGPVCTYQFCELVSKKCGRVVTMRAGKWVTNGPNFTTGKTQTVGIVQVLIYCPVATVAFVGQVLL